MTLLEYARDIVENGTTDIDDYYSLVKALVELIEDIHDHIGIRGEFCDICKHHCDISYKTDCTDECPRYQECKCTTCDGRQNWDYSKWE